MLAAEVGELALLLPQMPVPDHVSEHRSGPGHGVGMPGLAGSPQRTITPAALETSPPPRLRDQFRELDVGRPQPDHGEPLLLHLELDLTAAWPGTVHDHQGLRAVPPLPRIIGQIGHELGLEVGAPHPLDPGVEVREVAPELVRRLSGEHQGIEGAFQVTRDQVPLDLSARMDDEDRLCVRGTGLEKGEHAPLGHAPDRVREHPSHQGLVEATHVRVSVTQVHERLVEGLVRETHLQCMRHLVERSQVARLRQSLSHAKQTTPVRAGGKFVQQQPEQLQVEISLVLARHGHGGLGVFEEHVVERIHALVQSAVAIAHQIVVGHRSLPVVYSQTTLWSYAAMQTPRPHYSGKLAQKGVRVNIKRPK